DWSSDVCSSDLVPLLSRGDQRRDESAGLEELAAETRGHGTALVGRREPEVQGVSGRERGTVRHPRAAAPAHVVEIPGGRIIGGCNQRAAAVLGGPREPLRGLGIA